MKKNKQKCQIKGCDVRQEARNLKRYGQSHKQGKFIKHCLQKIECLTGGCIKTISKGNMARYISIAHENSK